MSLKRIFVCSLLVAGAALADPVQWPSSAGGNDHWYALTPGPGNWLQVNAMATSASYLGLPGYLVSILSQAEDDFLVQTFGGVQQLWIGFTDAAQEGTWVWSSGEPAGYTRWASGEPNNYRGFENYAIFNWRHATDPGGPPGFWNDLEGGSEFGIVEFSQVPEPSTWALIVAGLAGLRALGCRRRNG